MNNKFFKNIVFSIALLIAGFGTANFFGYSTNEKEIDQSHQDYFNRDYRVYSLILPQSMTFAGEKVPLELSDVKEKLDRELLVNTYWQSNTLLYLKKANKYFPIIEPILKKNGIPEDFKYLAVIESGLTHVVSPSGATGFWQIMKATGKEHGLEVNSEVDERYHIEKSTEVACQYLNEAHNKFGSWSVAAGSYNMGKNGMERQLKKQQTNNYYDLLLNEETSRYVYRILAAKEILSNPKKYGFYYRDQDLWNYIETDTLTIDTSISNLSDFAKTQGFNYKILKHFNPWLRKNQLNNKTQKKYIIKFPKEEYRNIVILQ